MYIETLSLKHFRGAKDLSLTLHPRLNVFVGMNGAGKSTILDASAILLSWLVNRIKHSGASGRPITEADILNSEAASSLDIHFNFQMFSYFWRLSKTRQGRKLFAPSILLNATKIAGLIQDPIEADNGQTNLPLFAYYPVNRAVLDIPLRIRGKHKFDPFTAYDGSLTSGANFRMFFEWFREREDLENEARRDKAVYSIHPELVGDSKITFPDPQLEAVRNALSQFMPKFSHLTVRRNPLRMEVEKNGKKLTVNQLSDGEKCLMALIGDLARRLAIINPLRDNPLEGEGVVLIDEIDLHFHPKWQRMLIPKLMDVFPNCQFLISTHSPHVITHVRAENLFLLKMTDQGLEALKASESYGKTVERILEDLMGLDTTRPDEVDQALLDIYRQIDDGLFDQAKQAIDELEKQIGEDPELVKANVLIKRKELIGK